MNAAGKLVLREYVGSSSSEPLEEDGEIPASGLLVGGSFTDAVWHYARGNRAGAPQLSLPRMNTSAKVTEVLLSTGVA